MDNTQAALAIVILLAGFWGLLLHLRTRKKLDPEKRYLVAAFMLIVSSAYTLVTKTPESLSFRAHVLLLLAVAVFVLFRSSRPNATIIK